MTWRLKKEEKKEEEQEDGVKWGDNLRLICQISAKYMQKYQSYIIWRHKEEEEEEEDKEVDEDDKEGGRWRSLIYMEGTPIPPVPKALFLGVSCDEKLL